MTKIRAKISKRENRKMSEEINENQKLVLQKDQSPRSAPGAAGRAGVAPPAAVEERARRRREARKEGGTASLLHTHTQPATLLPGGGAAGTALSQEVSKPGGQRSHNFQPFKTPSPTSAERPAAAQHPAPARRPDPAGRAPGRTSRTPTSPRARTRLPRPRSPGPGRLCAAMPRPALRPRLPSPHQPHRGPGGLAVGGAAPSWPGSAAAGRPDEPEGRSLSGGRGRRVPAGGSPGAGALPGEGQPFRAQKSEKVPSRPHLTEGNSGDPGPQPGPGPSPGSPGRVRKQRAHSAGGRAAPGRLLPCASPVGATMSLSKVTPACSACGMAARNPEVRGITGFPGETVARVLLDWDSRERPGFCHCLFALLDLSCERSMLTSPKPPKL
ncbi:translation initiation factor IF-2-like [Cervus elaphus]|uniref:translation initiation factor IF-2-like n=1 Tax=Cervus elaphus TaxID=9860 RepID=UPI001CC32ED6|nr:translation initiation factor IF-2-like [Cervus elaphus]